MEKRNLTCIVCPMGCALTVELEEGKVLSVSGNTCPRGEKYAQEECTHPTRVLTSTIRVADGVLPVVPVKTAAPIPKELLFEAMAALRELTVPAPVAIGDVICPDLCGTGIALLATSSVEKKEPDA